MSIRQPTIKFVVDLHEHIACSMATGYAQASGLPGVVYVSAAPGLVNLMAGLYNARYTRMPLVALVDQQDTQILNDDPPLSGPLSEMAKSVCKWTCELRTGGEIARVIRRAFHEALTPPRGPTLIALPVNILPRLSAGHTIKPPQTAPLGSAETSFLRKAAKILVDAENPCVVVGNEVSQYRARKEAVALVEVLGCPAYGEPMPTGVNFPNRHPQYAGLLPVNLPQAHRLLQAHDVCLILGMQSRLPARAHEPPFIGNAAFVLQINVEAGLAGRSLPCHLVANADMVESLSRLRTEIQLLANPLWVTASKQRAAQTISRISEKKDSDERLFSLPKPADPISLDGLLRLLDKLRPETSSIVSDLNAYDFAVADALSFKSSASYFASNAGVGGWALGASLGVQLASPNHNVICLSASNSMAQALPGLASALDLKLPVKLLVVNAGFETVGFQPLKLHPKPGDFKGTRSTMKISDFALASGMEAKSISLAGEVEAALKEMFASSHPYLLEASLAIS